jgi:hypothetical protein
MHAGNDYNPIALDLEEKAVREAPDAHATYLRMQNLEGEGTSRDDIHGGIHGQGKAQTKVRMNAFVPGKRFLEVGIRFR